MNKRIVVPLIGAGVLVATLFGPQSPAPPANPGQVDTGDAPWMLTATCLVLL